MIDIKVPSVGESISEVTLLKWTKKDGQYVDRDEVIAELESEKATFEVNAEKAGILKTTVAEGDTLNIGSVLAQIDETAQANGKGSEAKEAATAQTSNEEVPMTNDQRPTDEQAKATGKGVIEIKVPTVGESITEVTLVKWVKKEGDLV